MNLPLYIALGAAVIMSLITFFMYGADKRRARKDKWRISEKTLLLCALFMGAAGALAGMKVFRHKTKHLKFRILVPLCLIVNIAVIVAIGWWL